MKRFIHRKSGHFWLVTFLVMGVIAVVGVDYLLSPTYGLPYSDSFAANKEDGWHAFGGIWDIQDGSMRNESDERGARLVTGNPLWTNYRIEADVRFLGSGGDIGVVVRSNDGEMGVDAYNGYYVGLRKGDDSLIIGRANHGWMEGTPTHLPGGINAQEWFHLSVIVVGCDIGASATNLRTGEIAYSGFREYPCVISGKVGLRSLATGGEWRNVYVSAAGPAALSDIDAHIKEISGPLFPRTEAAYNATHSFPTFDHAKDRPNQADKIDVSKLKFIGSLASLKEDKPGPVSIRGIVVLTSPELYIQDATGGVAVVAHNPPLLNLGDEVAVTGLLEPHDYSAVIRDAVVQLLWDRAPLPPLSVTAAQAATGAVDAMLVEVPGYLERVSRDKRTTVLYMNDGAQSFRAVVNSGDTDAFYRRLAPHSFLRLRGICVLDSDATQRLTPFVLWLRSTNDVDIIEGPPWWSFRHLMQIAFGLLVLALLTQIIYDRIERWRFRAITQERVRLAHELHDTFAQNFAGLGFQLQGIRKGLRTSPPKLDIVSQQLDAACDIVRSTHEEASLSIVLLREDSPHVSDLSKALEACASQIVFGGNVSISISSTGQQRILSMRVTDALFHIGREAIVNAVKHSQPSRINIGIDYGVDIVTLVVEDDGMGFDKKNGSRGLGLRGMERRCAAVSGQLRIVSSPGEGCRVEAMAPLLDQKTYAEYISVIWLEVKKFRRMVIGK